MLVHPNLENWLFYLEGVLPREEEELISDHLASCPACRSRLDEWKSVYSFRAWKQIVRPGQGFEAGIVEAARQQGLFTPKKKISSLYWAAAAAVIIMLGLGSGRLAGKIFLAHEISVIQEVSQDYNVNGETEYISEILNIE